MESKMTQVIVETKKRSNSVSTYRMVDGVHEWDFGEGRIVKCNADKGSAQARHFLLNYGVKQWLQDGGAKSAGEDGKVSVQEKYEGMLDRAELIESGALVLVRKGGGPKKDDPGLLAAAMMRGLGLDAEGVKARIALTMKKKDMDEASAMKFWQDTRQVQDAKLAIMAERAAAKAAAAKVADADALLAEMMGEEGGE
jgi:hypothetical protein